VYGYLDWCMLWTVESGVPRSNHVLCRRRHNPAAKRAEKAAEATNTASSAAAMAAQDSDDSYTYKCDNRVPLAVSLSVNIFCYSKRQDGSLGGSQMQAALTE